MKLPFLFKICLHTGFLESFLSELEQEQNYDLSEYRLRVDLVRFPFTNKSTFLWQLLNLSFAILCFAIIN